MRTRIFTLILSLFIATMVFAEDVAVSVHVSTPGTLAQEIINAGSRAAVVTKLTVTGTLNDDDYRTMRETASLLYDINLSGVTDTYMPEDAFRGKSILQSIVLPENLTEIGSVAFSECSSLTSITIPNSVTSIGNSAFWNCYSLTSITIPNSVTSIGGYAFSYCYSLTSITIPNSVTSIGDLAFSYCYSLTSITIPNSVTSIGGLAFSDCPLTDITCYAGVPPTCGNDVFSSDVYSSATLTVPAVSKNDYLITSPWGAFLNIETMDVTYYQLSVTSSDENMGSVSETKKYYTPNEVVEIYAEPYNGYKFTGWSDGNTDNPRTITMTGNLTLTANFAVRPYEVTLTCDEAQGTVSGSGEYAPGTQVTITATAKEGYQFSYWRIYYNEWDYNTVYENPYTFEMGSQFYDIEAVFEKGKVLVDGLYYYLNDDNTATVTSPNGDGYSGDVVIPETIKVGGNTYTVTTIGNYAFDNAYITSVVIPATITYIGQEGFDDCYNLQVVKFMSVTPPTFYDRYLFNYGYYGKRMNVPCGSISAYEEAFGTSDRWYFAEGEFVLKVSARVLNESNRPFNPNGYVEIQDNIGCNDNQATIYAISDNNYRFKQWSDGVTDNPRTVTVTSDTTFVAEYTYYYTVEAWSYNEEYGTVEGAGYYKEGDTVTFIATPKEGYVLEYWYDDYFGNRYFDDTLNLVVYGNHEIIAYFRTEPILIDGIYYDYYEDDYTMVVVRSNKYSGDIVIPEQVTYNRTIYDVVAIDYYAFACTSITSLTVPNDVYGVDGITLNGCDDLKVLKAYADFISDIDGLYDTNIEEVYYTGGYVEYVRRISSLKVIDLSVTENTELERSLFREDADGNYEGFYNLRKLVLPNGLIKIHDRQFESLWLLEEVVIPEGVTEIPDGAFYDCHALGKVTLNENLTSIGNYAFYSCHALEDIVIPEGVTEIGNAAFYACTYLENIELPSTMQVVGDNAFALCNKVKRMEVKAVTPPAIEAKTVYEVSREIEFIVPDVAREAYAEHEYWKEFIQKAPNSVEDNESVELVVYSQNGMLYIEGITSDYRLFDATGKLIYTGRDAQLSLPNGIYLLNVDNKTYKVAM